MSDSKTLRLALGVDGVSVWSPAIFGDFEPSRVREFLSRAFAVPEVEGVELEPSKASGRIRYGAVENPAGIWRKLGRALNPARARASVGEQGEPVPKVDASHVYLDGAKASSIRVTRIGNVLSTWRLRRRAENRVTLSHPALRNRRDVVFRLEEELSGLLGVQQFRASALTASVSIRFDGSATSAERLASELERAWPRLLDGLDGPPSQVRLAAALGLLGLAFAGQYVAPALRPVAVAGMALYSFPNVVNGAKQLAQGRVGLPVLYSTGLTFMLVSGLPFTASVMAVFMQTWPHLSRRRIENAQRRLFAGQRRRPQWARVPQPDGAEVELSVDELREGALVLVGRGQVVPVDGIVVDGLAALVEGAPLGESGVVDKASGDAVRAGAFVQDGALTVRVEDAGGRSAATHVDSLLPRGPFPDLPASREAERIAERNVKPTLALAALSLFFTRTLQPAQGVIRPDYATGPRISAQLSTLRSVADGWRQGVLFRDLGALERLAAARVYVFDDSAGLERGALEVAQIDTSDGISAGLARGYALVAAEALPAEQSLALRAYASQRELTQPNGTSVQRFAGGIRYRSPRGKTVEIARTSYVLSSNAKIPDRFREALHEHGARPRRGRGTEVSRRDLSLDPLWVLRNGVVIGAISFARNGEPLARNLVAALRAQNRRARIIHVSRRGRTEANALARKLDIELVHAGLSHAGKQALVRSLGGGTLWVGDGSDPHVREAMLASSVSLSVAPSWKTLSDKADVLLPHEGLAGVTTAIAIARAHAARLAGDYRLVYAANLLGVAGALLTGLSPLRIGLLSNLGTGVVFARHARALERAAAAAEQEHGRLRSLPGR